MDGGYHQPTTANEQCGQSNILRCQWTSAFTALKLEALITWRQFYPYQSWIFLFYFNVWFLIIGVNNRYILKVEYNINGRCFLTQHQYYPVARRTCWYEEILLIITFINWVQGFWQAHRHREIFLAYVKFHNNYHRINDYTSTPLWSHTELPEMLIYKLIFRVQT